MRRWLLVGVCLTLGCASSGAPTLDRSRERLVDVQARSGTVVSTRFTDDDGSRQMELAIPLEDAWARLPEILAEVGLPIGFLDETYRRIGHDGARVRRVNDRRMSTYVDCGLGTTAQPNADAYQLMLGYEVILTPAGPDATRAAVRVDATARPHDVGGTTIHCASKGTLERLLLDGLRDTGEA